MATDFQIQQYRDDQLSVYQLTLVDDKEPELLKCAGCFDMVEEIEIKRCRMHDLNDGKELMYCTTCIDAYKQNNL